MASCKHVTLVLVQSKRKKRCRHCHLTISADELGDGHCPECLEAHGRKHSDFDDVREAEGEQPTYVCDECGARIG